MSDKLRPRKHRKQRDRHRSRSGSRTPNSSVRGTLSAILSRLDALKTSGASSVPTPESPRREGEVPAARAIVDVISAMNQTRYHSYYVSNFDLMTHTWDAWCEEVDRTKVLNQWDDNECLSQVAGSLEGDAKVWLNEWVSNDRSWSNFKREFRPLCPTKLDYAGILFEVMNTSDKYATYAEYARRTILRLRIVKGLSDELMTSIVIRGIIEPQIRAAAINADLTSDNLVSFLSIYAKSKTQPSLHKKRTMELLLSVFLVVTSDINPSYVQRNQDRLITIRLHVHFAGRQGMWRRIVLLKKDPKREINET